MHGYSPVTGDIGQGIVHSQTVERKITAGFGCDCGWMSVFGVGSVLGGFCAMVLGKLFQILGGVLRNSKRNFCVSSAPHSAHFFETEVERGVKG